MMERRTASEQIDAKDFGRWYKAYSARAVCLLLLALSLDYSFRTVLGASVERF